MTKINLVELASGIIIILIGTFFVYLSPDYGLGSIQRIGPGFVSYWTGFVIIVLGGLIILSGINQSEEVPRIPVRIILTISISIVFFAFFIQKIGLVGTVFLVSFISMYADRNISNRLRFLTACSVAFFCWIIFIVSLNLQIPAFRWRF